MYLLNATNLSHNFDTLLFEDINISIASKESLSIVGRSGSGKSTLLHICSSFLSPDNGKVELLSCDLYSKTDKEIETLRRYDIGIIFQFHYLFKGMSAFENIHIASMLSSEKIDEDIIQKLEIQECMDKKVGELSGGQQQRVSIARVLSKKPRIIFADEPTGNLDTQTASLVMDVLLDYVAQNDAGLMLVTHDIELANRCNQKYILDDKTLIKN